MKEVTGAGNIRKAVDKKRIENWWRQGTTKEGGERGR